MNRNQKIALGCGGAGCLGLVVVAIAGGLIYYLYSRPAHNRYERNYNFNVNTNRNSNSNDNSDLTTNRNDNASNSNSSSSSTSSMSEDEKHRLYQAGLIVGDQELLRRISVKIGIMDDDFTPGDNYQAFVVEQVTWAIQNTDFTKTINSPEKARAYINEHLN